MTVAPRVFITLLCKSDACNFWAAIMTVF